MSPQEMHIFFQLKMQESLGNTTKSFDPKEIDAWINDSAKVYIDKNFTPKPYFNVNDPNFQNTKGIFQNLENLVTTKELEVYVGDEEDKFVEAIVPFDCYKIIDDISRVKYNCSTIDLEKETDTCQFLTFSLLDSTTTSNHYQGLIINLYDDNNQITNTFNISNYGTYASGIDDNADKFYIVDFIIDYFNEISDVDVFYENFNGKYYKNKIILFTKSNYSKIDVNLPISTNYTFQQEMFFEKYITTDIQNKFTASNRLVKTEFVRDTLNHSFGKTLYDSPVSTWANNKIRVYYGDTFIIDKVILEYIKYPRNLDLGADQSSGIDRNFHHNLVNLAVENAATYMKPDNIELIKSNNLNIE